MGTRCLQTSCAWQRRHTPEGRGPRRAHTPYLRIDDCEAGFELDEETVPANLDLARSNRLRKGLLARQLARVNFGANMVRDPTKMLGGLHYEC
jgi:hypothetical protein